MKRFFSLAALNAVYFGTAAACAAWCVAVYGLTTPTSYVAGLTCCFYGFLTAASLLSLRPSSNESLTTGIALRTSTKLLLRGTCLLLPVAYFAFVAAFYIVEKTYCTAGGVARFEAFESVEELLFDKHICFPNPYFPASLDPYIKGPFQAWALNQWHSQSAKEPYDVTCRFELYKDGTIKKLRVSKSSGDKNCDQAALAALDSVAPALPADSPDWVAVEYTLAFGPAKDGWPVFKTDAITPSQDQFLFEQGQRANDFSDFPRSKKLLLQCLEERRMRFKAGSPELTDILHELADLYCRMGLLPESNRYFDDAIANATLDLKDHPEKLVATLNDYANKSFECSKFTKALSLYKKCCALNPTAFDRKAELRLAETTYATGDYNSAVKVFADVVRSDELAPPAQDEVGSLEAEQMSLCQLYIKAGHPEIMVKRIESLLSQYHAAKNSKSKNKILDRLDALLPVYESLPDRASGKRYIEFVFAELLKRWDPLSAPVKSYRSSLASLLWKSGNNDAALALFQQLVAKYHVNTADRAYALFDQAQFLFVRGKYSDAERSVREAQSIRMRLYDRNDKRVTNLKFALAAILIAEDRPHEAVAVMNEVEIPKDPEGTWTWLVSSSYAGAGQFAKALEITDAAIRKTYKNNPDDEGGERINLLEQAIFLSEKLGDDKRLEEYLKETYKSELKRLGCANRVQLIQFYLDHNQLAIAENLANREVNDTYPENQSISTYERHAISFLLLAQVKDAQKRHDTARYYVERAVAVMKPYGRSEIQINAVGLLAQISAKEGNLKLAEQLLENLYNNELVDADRAVSGDIVPGFNTTGCYFTSSGSRNQYNNVNEQRSDPEINPASIQYIEASPRPLHMITLNWLAARETSSDLDLLQASALEARARIQTLESKHKEAADCRALLLEKLEVAVGKPSYCKDLEGFEQLLKEIPSSASQQKLLLRVRQEITNQRISIN